MILRPVHGWQVLLADLSLILFITAAATLARTESRRGPYRSAQTAAFPRSGDTVAAAVYRVERGDGPDALRAWIADYSPDPRESLDITILYQPGTFGAATDRAGALMRQAQASGQAPRITLEAATPRDGHGETVTASFAFSGDAAVARELQNTP